jgi:hypothetical protein
MTDEPARSAASVDWLHAADYSAAKKARRLTMTAGGVGLLAGILSWSVPAFHKLAPGLTTTGPAVFAAAIAVAYFRYYTALRRFQEKHLSLAALRE